jgi:hypothetical protein
MPEINEYYWYVDLKTNSINYAGWHACPLEMDIEEIASLERGKEN